MRSHQVDHLRATLRAMPRHKAPASLRTRLEVAASQHLAGQARRSTFRTEFGYWTDVFRVWSSNLMRPLALPAVGGLVTAIFMFMMVAPMYGVRAASSLDPDVPTVLSTTATLKQSTLSFGIENRNIVVDVLIDEQGRFLDYSVPLGQVWQQDPEIRRCVFNALLCTQFEAGTVFGQPKSGKLRITFRRNQVDVQG